MWDVLVVGAGPAGSAAALAALRAAPGARVALLDRSGFPRDKTCGDGIVPHAVAELVELGVPGGGVDGYRPVEVLRVRTESGTEMVGPSATPNFVVPRAVFDARLVAAAVAAGAVFVREPVRRIEQRATRVLVNGAHAARVVIGADGAQSTVRRLIGAAPNPPHTVAVALRGYAPAPAGVPEQLLHLVDDGWPAYAWSFPIGDGRANVGFGLLRSALGGGGKQRLHDSLARLLPHAVPDAGTLRAAQLPLATGRPPLPDGRVLLAGDAAGLVNPLTGEGIYYAVLSGRLAGEAAVRGPDAPGGRYRAALRAELGAHLRSTRLLSEVIRREPRLIDNAVRLAATRRDVFDAVGELGLGRGTLPPQLIGTVAAAVARAAVRRAVC